MAMVTYLWKLCDQVMGNFHGVVDKVKYLGQLPFIGCQNLWDGNNNVLDLILLKAKLYFAHLQNTFKKKDFVYHLNKLKL